MELAAFAQRDLPSAMPPLAVGIGMPAGLGPTGLRPSSARADAGAAARPAAASSTRPALSAGSGASSSSGLPAPRICRSSSRPLAPPPRTSFIESLTGTISTLARPKQQASPGGAGKTVFVAGSTGRTGARVVRELLAAGYRVKAGCRSLDSAQSAIDVAEAYGLLKPDQMKRLELVQFDLGKPDTMRAALAGASRWGGDEGGAGAGEADVRACARARARCMQWLHAAHAHEHVHAQHAPLLRRTPHTPARLARARAAAWCARSGRPRTTPSTPAPPRPLTATAPLR